MSEHAYEIQNPASDYSLSTFPHVDRNIRTDTGSHLYLPLTLGTEIVNGNGRVPSTPQAIGRRIYRSA